MWADNETSEDLLGFKVHADLLINVINDEKVLPVTIGVFGDWGSGKSSILQIIYKELKPEKEDELKDETLVLYFNGWVFEGYDDAKAALLAAILNAFKEHKKLGAHVKDEALKMLKSVKWMRLVGLGLKKIVIPTITAFATGGLSLIPFLAQELGKLDAQTITDKLKGEDSEEFLKSLVHEKEEDATQIVREFRDDFEELINKSKIKKLVVIIDDLDRCTSDRIIENLEAIKLFLNVPKTAFIIGADPRIVRHAIEHRYKTDRIESSNDEDTRNKRIVSDYLEKLIQIPYNLPRLSDAEVETYMTLLFCKKELGASYSGVLEAFQNHRLENRYSVFGFSDIETRLHEDEREKLKKSIQLITSLAPIITKGLNGNPRQIKRFLNAFTLRNRLVEVAKLPDFKSDILAKLMVLEYSSPNLFRELYEWQSTQDGEPKEIVEIEQLASQDNEELKNKRPTWSSVQTRLWLNTEPKLPGVDLRDYYWVSRDQLFSSISGSTMIPPHLRILFKKITESGSKTILENNVKQSLSTIPDIEAAIIVSLFEKAVLKSPEEKWLHEIYIELLKQNITNSFESYERVLKQISHKKIPFSIAPLFEIAAKSNTKVESIISLIDKDSSIFKGFKKASK